MISEENKQEADKVVKKYGEPTFFMGDLDINCAIQDRQSVLEDLNEAYRYINYEDKIENFLSERIQNLTQQIEYLKSKI